MKPLFVLSLPRSGSTLLQRMLSVSPNICTQPEPWFLLPLLTLYQERGISSNYGHGLAYWGAKEFVDNIPSGQRYVDVAIRRLAMDLYQSACGQAAADYFLDKTPRYYLVAPHLLRIFPDARFIVLWRDPISVISSMVTTWLNDRWRPQQFITDLLEGVDALLDAAQQDEDRVRAVHYEALVYSPAPTLNAILEWLRVPVMHDYSFARNIPLLTGMMGDALGQRRYGTDVSRASVGKWSAINTAWRARWCRRYVHRLGDDRLAAMGYDKVAILRSLRDMHLPPLSLVRDAGPHFREWAYAIVRDQIWYDHSITTSVRRMAGPTKRFLASQERAVDGWAQRDR